VLARQFGIAEMYGNGLGVMMDDALWLKWYSLVDDLDYAKLSTTLASCISMAEVCRQARMR